MSGAGIRRDRILFNGAALLLGLFAGVLGGLPDARMPQRVTGGDVLSVAFGDAKALVSTAMMRKADSYFHGGVDMDCHHLEGHAHDPSACEDHACEHHADESEHAGRFDLWAEINRRIRAPELDRHLEGEKAVELMPWFWASVRANPHNVEAWTATWYVAEGVMKDAALALRVVEEGKKANPGELEILLCEARTVFAHGRGDVARARGLFAEIARQAQARCEGDAAQLTEHDRWMLQFAERYRAECEKILKSAK